MAGVAAPSASNTPRYSSSPELSSPPRSISDPGSPAAAQLTAEHRNAQNNTITVNYGVDEPQKPPRKKPGRKPKIQQPENGNATAPAPATVDAPKTRKPRKPRDPNNVPTQRKKKSMTADPDLSSKLPAAAPPKQLKPAPEMGSPPVEPTFHVPPNATNAQYGKTEDIPKPAQPVSNSFFNSAPPPSQQQQQQPPPPPPPQQQQQQQQQVPQPTPPQASQQLPQQIPQQVPQQPPPRTSGQNYDPIRSNYDPVRETVVSHNPFSTSQMSPRSTQLVNRASASPSISSLVDPPNQASTSPSMATQSFFSHQMKMQGQTESTSVPPSPTVSRLGQPPMMPSSQVPVQQQQMTRTEQPQPEQWVRAQPVPTYATSSAPVPGQGHFSTIGAKRSPNPVGSTATSSAAQSPKPQKLIDITPPPLPGSGALSMLGNGPKDSTESRAPTIVLDINIQTGEPGNKYINFTRMAEERYGWEALHPRLAAQRERLARVAAAGAALEKNSLNKESGDEMSLDMSEGEGSNIEMGGMSDGRTGTDNGTKKPVRKRKMKEDEYDKDDGFVDDTELLWEEQAAASKDGFFVYSGPLVPEGEKPLLERADGAPKRGRGRGRGGSTRGSTSTRGGGTGGGPGSRGGTTTRKPRITKADRARMEMEKKEREAMGSLAAKPSGYAAGMTLASAAMGGTPMVFNQ